MYHIRKRILKTNSCNKYWKTKMSFKINCTKENLKDILTEVYQQNSIDLLNIMTEVIHDSRHRELQERQEQQEQLEQQEQATSSSRTLGSEDTWSPSPSYSSLDEIVNEELMYYEQEGNFNLQYQG